MPEVNPEIDVNYLTDGKCLPITILVVIAFIFSAFSPIINQHF